MPGHEYRHDPTFQENTRRCGDNAVCAPLLMPGQSRAHADRSSTTLNIVARTAAEEAPDRQPSFIGLHHGGRLVMRAP
jgi:hypothetical protein